MNVLVTCHTYYPNNDGVQFVTQYLCEGLVKRGHKVTVVTVYYENRNMCIEEVHNGVRIIRIKAKTVHKIHFGDKKQYIDLIKRLSKENDVMINVYTQCVTTDWLFNELKEINIPKVLYMHSTWDFRYTKDDFSSFKKIIAKIWGNLRWRSYYIFNKSAFRKYDIVTQLHEKDYATDFFKKKYGINSVIMENAAEDVFFNKHVNKDIPLPHRYIINVSNFYKRKNQIKCLELFLSDSIPDNWSLILIGSRKTAYSEQIEERYADFKNENPKTRKQLIVLYGVPRSNIDTYVKKASFCMMTSKWEAFPISLIECMAAGTPFISSDVGIVKHLSGGVVCKKDSDYLKWMNVFMNNEEIREEYGRRGREEAMRRYTIDSKVRLLEKILSEISQGKRNK